MIKSILRLFSKDKKRKSAGGWLREEFGITKTKRMTDGEVTSHLVGPRSKADLAEYYDELKLLRSERDRSLSIIAFGYVLTVVALFGIPSSVSASGIVFPVESLVHIGMGVLAYSSWRFSNVNSKLGYLRSYFEHLYFKEDSRGRAELLLRYPSSIPAFLYDRDVRGYPEHVWPKRRSWFRNLPQYGLMLGVATGLIVALVITIAAYITIWNSAFPTPFFSKAYVIVLIASGIFVWANPTFTSLGRDYRHFGLSNTLASLPEDRRQDYQKLIARIQVSWYDGLDPPDNPA